MKLQELVRSPLAATAGVLLGMALIAIPMRQLTSAAAPKRISAAPAEAEDLTPAWLTLKLLAPARSVTLSTPEGETRWSLEQVPAGETEAHVPMRISTSGTQLILDITFVDPSAETAAFLSIAPNALEEVTAYATGRGTIRELLSFSWPSH